MGFREVTYYDFDYSLLVDTDLQLRHRFTDVFKIFPHLCYPPLHFPSSRSLTREFVELFT